ncbi:DUF4303 domain-containing protein [Pigmentiphaga aceris]|uniref:DUF4303 domain-containing protein n=1 Tax=Pigmentiphaga aceris TaxID=1940612 RepID=A0A5C0AYI7_9BURK|nr:DUF4303 domain-containing protein [Pigmentiphaga aceris]QEI06756.1 DUF4303 domain-containing protein [Pigmentiphaga aceris]
MNWNELENEVYAAAKEVFVNVQNAHPNEQFYAFALYTDSGAMTICPAANSVEGLTRELANDETDPDGEEAAYYRWATSEWAYESWQADSFNDICTKLGDIPESEDFAHTQAKVYEVMTNALARLSKEGVFKPQSSGDAPVLFVTLTDDDEAEDVENRSAKVLNSPEVFEKFVNRFGREQ